MKILKLLLCAIAYSLSYSYAYAITLTESVLAANEFDPEIFAARNEHDAERQKRIQGFSGLLPHVSLDGSWSRSDQPKSSYAAGVTRHNASINLSQTIFDLSKLATWKKGGVIADKADVKLLQAQQNLIQKTINGYYEVIYRRVLLNNKKQLLKLYQQKLNQARTQLMIGDGTRLDINDAQASLDRAESDIVNAKSDLNDAENVFQVITGHSATEIPDRTFTCIPAKRTTSREQMIADMMKNNLDIREAWLSIKQSEADVLTATSSHLPVVSLQAGYGTNWSRAEESNQLDELFGTTSKTRNTTFSINVSLPLFAGGNGISKSIEAANRHSQSKDLLALTQLQSRQSLNASLNAISSGFTRLSATEHLVNSTSERLRSTRYGKEIGMRTLIDELDSLNDYASALNEKSESQFALIKAQSKLSLILGDLDITTLSKYSCPQS